mmetsp:Transcript_42190/g.82782  ORF Transcript_42190/g.82782 Transcript_42190/m.82782 type:complete len:268 (+) Transcript_42190:1109-1912(+)
MRRGPGAAGAGPVSAGESREFPRVRAVTVRADARRHAPSDRRTRCRGIGGGSDGVRGAPRRGPPGDVGGDRPGRPSGRGTAGIPPRGARAGGGRRSGATAGRRVDGVPAEQPAAVVRGRERARGPPPGDAGGADPRGGDAGARPADGGGRVFPARRGVGARVRILVDAEGRRRLGREGERPAYRRPRGKGGRGSARVEVRAPDAGGAARDGGAAPAGVLGSPAAGDCARGVRRRRERSGRRRRRGGRVTRSQRPRCRLRGARTGFRR